MFNHTSSGETALTETLCTSGRKISLFSVSVRDVSEKLKIERYDVSVFTYLTLHRRRLAHVIIHSSKLTV